MNRKQYLSLALMLLCACTLKAQQQISQRIDSLMTAVNRIGIFNGNVLVVHQGKTIYKKALGYSSGKRTALLSTEKLFDIGSIAKEFNGTAILLLQEKGKLSLDDRLSKYLPELPKWADSIKLKHLINYSSGLPITNANNDEEHIEELKKLPQLVATPGTLYAYSYSNVLLQRKVIEKVSGKTYNAFVEQALLKPLHLKHTLLDLSPTDERMAQSFDSDFNDKYMLQPPQGWVRTTVDDLYTWITQLDAGKVVSQKSLVMLAQNLAEGESSLGNVKLAQDKIIWHRHHGSNHNYEALVTNDLTNDIVVVLLTNSQQFKVSAISDAILNMVTGKPYTVPRRSLYLDLRDKVLNNLDSGMAFYRNVKEQQTDKYDLSFEIGDVINTGKYVMRRKRYDDAIQLFLFGTTLPIANTDYSYACQLAAECFQKKGQPELAILYLQKALEKHPANESAKTMLALLMKK